MTKQKNTTTSVPTGQEKEPRYETIKVSIDWHVAHYQVVRIIDNSGPQPAQRFTPEDFILWMRKQLTLAEKVYSCYEAGAGGFVLHRRLSELGVTNYVVVPRKLDRNRKGVVTDKTDARQLALDLDNYVKGNDRALQLAYVPTPAQEQERQESRQRGQLLQHRKSLGAQGQSLMLSQGIRQAGDWWKAKRWEQLKTRLEGWLVQRLERYQKILLVIDKQLQELTAKLEAAAPKDLPVGLGALTFETARREVCDWERFRNRKAAGAYSGLVGGVSASGSYLCQLPITKAGNTRLRTLLIELAWRMVHFQSQSKVIQKWKSVLLNPKASRRARKRAIVAVARQLAVELWRWQTGKTQLEDLGWRRPSAEVYELKEE